MDSRTAPVNIDAEEGILACCLTEDSRHVVSSCIEQGMSPSSFFKPAHKLFFEAILKVYEAGDTVEEIALSEQLQKMGALDEIGGYAGISAISSRVDTAATAPQWSEIVMLNAHRRSILDGVAGVSDMCYASEELPAILDKLGATMASVECDTGDSSHICESVDSVMEELRNPDVANEKYISTGFKELDYNIRGFLGGQFILIGAPSGVGKSVLGGQICTRSAMQHNPWLYFSFEMGVDECTQRTLAQLAKVNLRKVYDKTIRPDEVRDLENAAMLAGQLPIYYHAKPCGYQEMLAIARRHQQKYGIRGIFVDSIQRMKKPSGMSLYEATTANGTALKDLAKELDLPVLAVTMVNDEGNTRNSGDLKYDCDMYMTLHREKGASDGKLTVGGTGKVRGGNDNWTIDLEFNASLPAWEEAKPFAKAL